MTAPRIICIRYPATPYPRVPPVRSAACERLLTGPGSCCVRDTNTNTCQSSSGAMMKKGENCAPDASIRGAIRLHSINAPEQLRGDIELLTRKCFRRAWVSAAESFTPSQLLGSRYRPSRKPPALLLDFSKLSTESRLRAIFVLKKGAGHLFCSAGSSVCRCVHKRTDTTAVMLVFCTDHVLLHKTVKHSAVWSYCFTSSSFSSAASLA